MFKLDRKKCTNCKLCVQACAWQHEQPLQAPAYARIHIKDDWPDVKAIQVCTACPKKSCIEACNEDALWWDGYVHLDKDKCTNCLDCVDVCPFNAVFVDPRDTTPLICDTCDGAYSCVAQCPTGAIRRMPA